MNDMIEVKTADLTGTALDWAVAIVETGNVLVFPEGGHFPPAGSVSLNDDNFTLWLNDGERGEDSWSPSTDWGQGGPLIEAYKLDIGAPMENHANGPWNANTEWGHPKGMAGPTPLVAACRAIVAAKLGEAVSVPAELAKQ